MLNANAPEFLVSSTALLPTYYCFSSPSDWYYHYSHWYQAPPCPYRLCVPNGSSLQYVEGMGGEARTKSSGNRSRRRTGRNGKVVVSRWRSKSKPSQVIDVKVPTLFEFKEEVAEVVGKTTVMIRNIPNKYRNMLIDLLDKHCAEVNKKIASLGEKEKQPPSTYDFVYLPMDFKSRCNLGYAFVNFTTPIATSRFYRFLHKSKWQDFFSNKICQITYARIQGKRALKAHFSQSSFACDSDEYLPVEFIPPRDGLYASVGVTSGKRLSSRP